MSAITYHRLTPEARATITEHGIRIADYVRHFAPDGQWGGDRCGCHDDRCIGYHHDAMEDCGCLPAILVSLPMSMWDVNRAAR